MKQLQFECLIVVICLTLSGTINLSFGLVQVQIVTSPLVNRDPILLTNKDFTVTLKCFANFPIEIVIAVAPITTGPHLQEMARTTDVRFQLNMVEAVDNATSDYEYKYSAFSYMATEYLKKSEGIICRSVANHTDNMGVHLIPITMNGMDLINVTKYTFTEKIMKGSEEKTNGTCKIRFEVGRVLDHYYWRCTRTRNQDARGHVYFTPCDSSASCSNILRHNRTSPLCLTEVHNLTLPHANLTTEGWQNMESQQGSGPHGVAGVAVCLFEPTSDNPDLWGLEYFYEVNSFPNGDVERILRFSQPDIPMHKLMWLEPAPRHSTYYTRETLPTSCHVPGYGFAYFAQARVTLNGSRIPELGGEFTFKDILRGIAPGGRGYVDNVWILQINFGTYGPGNFLIECIAPVWNTTEWANHNRTIEVRHQIPLTLMTGNQTIELEEGEANRTLTCDVNGDPAPNITWSPDNAPGVLFNGRDIFIERVTTALPRLITCTAVNQFNETLAKSFALHVSEKSVAVPVTLGIFCALLFVAGLTFIYVRLWKRAKAIEVLLTDEEVKEFLEGKLAANANCNYVPLEAPDGYIPLGRVPPAEEDPDQGQGSHDLEPLSMEAMPYNSEFEVTKENFIVDYKSKLGSGEFGVVYKGHIKLNHRDRNPTPVAVKTVPKHMDIDCFRALLSELKIFAYLGHHENVVKLIGAYSQNIKSRELLVGVEFCKTSLLDFLQDNCEVTATTTENSGQDELQASTSELCERNRFIDGSNVLSVRNLMNWAAEIATGMEFLSRKRVVHADLAARNVLLSFDLHAKISDFGLARHLINYSYIKTTDCPLPWKWMPIESLTQRKFSTYSDVWSYGVTLWEIFSLGHIPYPTIEWDDDGDFVDKLRGGLRLTKPEYASMEVFQVMQKCWNENPTERPKFSELKAFFETYPHGSETTS